VDIDQEPELASVFGIRSIPTFLFIPMKGNPTIQMGAMQKEDFEEIIGKMMGK
jgi:thioredoxin 1